MLTHLSSQFSIYWLSFFILFVILLVPSKMMYSLLRFSHFACYVMRLWMLHKLPPLALSLCIGSWWCECLLNFRQEWDFSYPRSLPWYLRGLPKSPIDTQGSLLQLGGGGALTPHHVSSDTSLNGECQECLVAASIVVSIDPAEGWVASLLLNRGIGSASHQASSDTSPVDRKAVKRLTTYCHWEVEIPVPKHSGVGKGTCY